jgi:hypothetical protein
LSLFSSGYFWNRVLLFCPGWPEPNSFYFMFPTNAGMTPIYWLRWESCEFFAQAGLRTVLLPISASQVARITGVSCWCLASFITFYEATEPTLSATASFQGPCSEKNNCEQCLALFVCCCWWMSWIPSQYSLHPWCSSKGEGSGEKERGERPEKEWSMLFLLPFQVYTPR